MINISSYFRRYFVLIVLLGVATSARAWGPTGHEIAASIAELHLTPKAKAGIAELLAPTRHISDNGVANWPDFIRHDRPESAPWHFVNIPFDATRYDPKRDCKDGNCVVEAVERFATVLGNTDATFVTRNETLRFLVHFVGDIHQPLHCAERNGDRGGNLRAMTIPHEKKTGNLHKVWDTELVHECLGTKTIADFARTLNDRVTPAKHEKWTSDTPADWAWESHRLAVEHTYKDIPSDGAPLPLTAAYIAANRPIVELQLTKAGLRLAFLLNKAFP
jgi:hypothetical protein